MMNKYNEMTMDELKAELDKQKNELSNIEKVIEPLRYSFVNDMTEWMTNLMKDTNAEIDLVQTDFICMRVPGKGRYEINLRIDDEYPNGFNAPSIKVIKMDTCNVGNVSIGDVDKVNYILAMGVVVQKLDAILNRFTNSKVLAKLSNEQCKLHAVSWEIDKIKNAMRDIERNGKKEDALKEIKAGVVICTNDGRNIRATITRVGKKCVFLDDGWKNSRYELAHVADQIASGYWKIVK